MEDFLYFWRGRPSRLGQNILGFIEQQFLANMLLELRLGGSQTGQELAQESLITFRLELALPGENGLLADSRHNLVSADAQFPVSQGP